jgi:hypothetical protein
LFKSKNLKPCKTSVLQGFCGVGESQNFDIIPELETDFLYDLISSEAAFFTNKRIDAWVYSN